MAATVTRTTKNVRGSWHCQYNIVETGIRDTTETTITGVPEFGTIVTFYSVFVSGTGSTVNPELGSSSGWTTNDINQVLPEPGSAAALIRDLTRTPYHAPDGILYLRSQPNNTATDHTVHTKILIVTGFKA
jgi:hypothetical protein